MKLEEAAWLAGYIDGDGCVCLGYKGGRGWRSPLLVIDSTDLELLHEVQRLCGGRLQAKRRSAEHHRQAWSWRLTGADTILTVLSEIRPFMRCADKAARADLLLTEWRVRTTRNGHYDEGAREAKSDLERRFFAIGHGRGSTIRRAAA